LPDNHVVALVTTYLNEGDSERLKTLKSRLTSEVSAANECVSRNQQKFSQACQSQVSGNAIAMAITGGTAAEREAGGERAKASCIAQQNDVYCMRDANQTKGQLKDFRFTSSQYEITVKTPARNYEGNMIAYVNVRRKGTDMQEAHKVTMQFENGAWRVVDIQ
jgi:hypothetical protein